MSTASVGSSTIFPQVQQTPPNCLEKLKKLAYTIFELSIRILFVFASILMTAAIIPHPWQIVVLPFSVCSAAFLSGFLFTKPGSQHKCTVNLEPLIRVERKAIRDVPVPRVPPAYGEGFPVGGPTGYINAGMNCAINAMSHFLDSDPSIARFFRQEIPDNMDDFREFVEKYNPPDGILDAFEDEYDEIVQFVHEANGQAEAPAVEPNDAAEEDSSDDEIVDPPMIQTFNAFLTRYAQEHDNHGVRNLADIFSKLEVLHPAFKAFFEANDIAIQNRYRYSQANSQNLRLALNQIINNQVIISRSVAHQVDVTEIVSPVLDLLPPEFRLNIRTAYIFRDFPYEQPAPQDLKHGMIAIPLDEEAPNQSIQELLQNYQTSHVGTRPVNGVVYHLQEGLEELVEAPDVLRVSLRRFMPREVVDNHWYNRWLPSLYPPQRRVVTVKIDQAIDGSEEVSVRDIHKNEHRYQLTSFVVHLGSAGGGHYIACEKRGEDWFIENDSRVSLVTDRNRHDFDELRSQAYMLSYRKMEE